MSPDSNVIETEATSKASTELPNMSPDSNVIETEYNQASTELPDPTLMLLKMKLKLRT